MILSSRTFMASRTLLRNHSHRQLQLQLQQPQQQSVISRYLFSHPSYSLLSSRLSPSSSPQQQQQEQSVISRCLFSRSSSTSLLSSRFLTRSRNSQSISLLSSFFPTTTSMTLTITSSKSMSMSTEIGQGSINHAIAADTCCIGKLKENPARNKNKRFNKRKRKSTKYSKYLQSWSLQKLISINNILLDDNPNNDSKYAVLIYDFIKRIEINSDRLTDLQQKVESLYSRLRNIQSNNNINNNIDNKHKHNDIQDMMHILEDERKTLRNLQRLHYDTWQAVSYQHKLWDSEYDDDNECDGNDDGNDDDNEDNEDNQDEDNEDEDDDAPPLMMIDPKKRVMRWNALVDVATEIQARHSLTIEQMSELVIKFKPLYNQQKYFYHEYDDTSTEDNDIKTTELQLNDLYDTVCSFMRCRMTQQLLCQHLIAMGKDALGTNVVTNNTLKPQKEQQQSVDKEVVDVDNNEESRSSTQPTQPIRPIISDRIIGAVNVNTSIVSLVRSSITEASQLCEATYLISPPVTFVIESSIQEEESDSEEESKLESEESVGGKKSKSESSKTSTNTAAESNHGNENGNEKKIHVYENVSGTFVRAWLQYALIELLKNAMAATVENNPNIVNRITTTSDDDDDDHDDDHDDDTDSKSKSQQQQQQHLPTLYVHIYEDTISGGNVVIKLLDQGGGIQKGSDDDDYDLESLFRFAQRETVWDRMDEQQTYAQMRSPLKGLGVGLSLSRWHMRHFGGDLTLENRSGSNPTIRVRGDSPDGRRSKWNTLDKGMTATILIPKDDSVPVVIS